MDTVETIRDNLGRVLLEFLNTYGNILDYNMTEIHPNLPNENQMINPFQQSQKMFNMNMMMNNGYITVYDPLNRSNNVTRPTHRFYVIRVNSHPKHPPNLLFR